MPSSSRSIAPQVLVDPQGLGGVAFRGERAHQHALSALPQRRGLDQGAARVAGGGELSATQPDACGRVGLEGTHAELFEVAPDLIDPRSVFSGQEPATGGEQRHLRGGPRTFPLLLHDGRLGPVDRFLGHFEIDRRIGQRQTHRALALHPVHTQHAAQARAAAR